MTTNVCGYMVYPLYNLDNIWCSLQIDGREVECNPHFKLFLVSSDDLTSIPPTLFSVVAVVDFQPERKGIEELLLSTFLQLQNVKTHGDRQELSQELHTQSTRIEEVERELLELIAHQEEGQIENPKSIKNILTLNKTFEDAQERYNFNDLMLTTTGTFQVILMPKIVGKICTGTNGQK